MTYAIGEICYRQCEYYGAARVAVTKLQTTMQQMYFGVGGPCIPSRRQHRRQYHDNATHYFHYPETSLVQPLHRSDCCLLQSLAGQVRKLEARTGCFFISDLFLVGNERALDYTLVWIETIQKMRTPCAGMKEARHAQGKPRKSPLGKLSRSV